MRRAFVLVLALVATMLSVSAPGARASAGSLLFYGPTILGFPDTEATLAQAAGYDVTVADASTWLGMTTFEFEQYDAIVFGDPTCTESPAPLGTAMLNQSTWSLAVNGPKVVIGTDPIFHQSEFGTQANQLSLNAMAFAASGPGTGLYANLSCYYSGQSTAVDWLSFFGTFQVAGQGAGGLDACPDDVGILQPDHPVMNGITLAGLANWSCSIHEAFTSYPPAFSPVAQDNPTQLPYVIATGGGGGVITDAPQRYAPYVWLHS